MAQRGMKQPETSLEAYKSLDPEKLNKIHKDIVTAVNALGKAHFEQIANYLGVKPERIWKRMSEVRLLGLIHLTDSKERTSSGRVAFQYAPGPTPESAERKKRIMKGKTVQEFAKAILQPNISKSVQQTLF